MSQITNQKTISNRVSEFWKATFKTSGATSENDACCLIKAARLSSKGKRIFSELENPTENTLEHQLAQNCQALCFALPQKSENRLPVLHYLAQDIHVPTAAGFFEVSDQFIRNSQSMSTYDLLSRSFFSSRKKTIGTCHFSEDELSLMKTWLEEEFPPHSGVVIDCFIMDERFKEALEQWHTYVDKNNDRIWEEMTAEKQKEYNLLVEHHPELSARQFKISPQNRSMETFRKMLKKFRIRYRRGDWTWCLCDICASNKALVKSLKGFLNITLKNGTLSVDEQLQFTTLQQQASIIYRDKHRTVSLFNHVKVRCVTRIARQEIKDTIHQDSLILNMDYGAFHSVEGKCEPTNKWIVSTPQTGNLPFTLSFTFNSSNNIHQCPLCVLRIQIE